MRNFIVFAMTAALLTIFNGCQKDELIDQGVDVQSQDVIKPDVYAENGYLAFKNIGTVDSMIQILSKMTMEEKSNWEESMNFVSARREFDKLFAEYEKINSFDEFLFFKNKYSDKLQFNEMDNEDCSIDYPYDTRHFLPVLNNNGVVKIGMSLIKYTKDDQVIIKNGDINILNNLEANIDNENVVQLPKLKSIKLYTHRSETLIHNFPEDNPMIPFSSNAWHTIKNIDKRRMINELFIERYRTYDEDYMGNGSWWLGYYIYLEQRAHKRSWGSWNSDKTRYYFDQLKVQVGSEPIYEYNPGSPVTSPEVKTGHIYLYYKHNAPFATPYPSYVPEYLDIPTVSLSLKTSCQGFDIANLYPIDIIKHSGFNNPGGPWTPNPGY